MKNYEEILKEISEDLNKLLIKLDSVKTFGDLGDGGVHYSEHTSDRKPHSDPKYANDPDFDDIYVNYDKVKLVALKTIVKDILNNKNKLYDMYDEYKLSYD